MAAYVRFCNIFFSQIAGVCYQIISAQVHTKNRQVVRAVFFYLIPTRKKVIFDNLNLCYPNKSTEWKQNTAKECYQNLGINLFEILYFPRMRKDIIEQFVSFENYEYIFEALKKGKGVFFLSGHISNWELTAFSYSKVFRSRLNIIAKPQSNSRVNRKINEYRELGGNNIVETGAPTRTIFNLIKKNEIVCFLMDQSAHPDYSLYVDFFGHKVATFQGASKIALKNNTEILFGYGQRTKNYKYMMTIEKIKCDDLKEYSDENVYILTQRINKKLEETINKNPGQWLWLHRRFKHIKKD